MINAPRVGIDIEPCFPSLRGIRAISHTLDQITRPIEESYDRLRIAAIPVSLQKLGALP